MTQLSFVSVAWLNGYKKIMIRRGKIPQQGSACLAVKDKYMDENREIDVIREGTRWQEAQEQRKVEKNRKIGYSIIVILMLVALVIAYQTRSFNIYEELTSTPSSEGTKVHFAVYGKGYLKYSKDGISYLNQKEKLIWTEAYTMEEPTISIKDDYAVLADLSGNGVHLYNEDGKVGDYSMSYPIQKIFAAEQGVFCVLLDGENANYIQLYDKKGTMLAEIKTQIENSGKGYPLDLAISPDGSKMAVSLYRVEGIDSKNTLAFYNFGDGGKGQDGNLVGTYDFEDTLIPKVEFMGDDIVYAVGSDKTIIYKMKEKPKKMKELTFDSEILSVFSDEDYVGYICQNNEDEVLSGEKKLYQTYIYNKKGKLVESFDKEELHDTVSLVDHVLISYSAGTCVMERMNGKEIFRQDMGENIVDILPTSKAKEFLFVYGSRSSRIRLKNTLKEKESEVDIIE